MKLLIGAILPAVLAMPLTAQDKQHLGISKKDNGIVYAFQFRAMRADSELAPLVGKRTSGGGGFSALFGDTPLRFRLRMDGDIFQGKDGQGPVSTAGAGIEGVYFLPTTGRTTPFVSMGAALQHWEITYARVAPNHTQTANHLAGRAELGLKLGRTFAVSLGVLVGSTASTSTTANPYLAVSIAP